MIRPHDYLDIDHLLSDEERAIRDAVRAFVADRILPNVGDWFEAATFPTAELAPELIASARDAVPHGRIRPTAPCACPSDAETAPSAAIRSST